MFIININHWMFKISSYHVVFEIIFYLQTIYLICEGIIVGESLSDIGCGSKKSWGQSTLPPHGLFPNEG